MSGPQISGRLLWERHEQRVLAILRSALHRLRTKELHDDERKLNRELYSCILEVNGQNKKSGSDSWFDYPPIYEGQNPPTPDTEDSASERKIPDLQWGYIDHQEPDPRRSVRNFAIECKRLGAPSSPGWKLNVNYVTDGVHRFADPEFRYGKDVASGAMAGYVESMSLEEIVAEVNRALNQIGVPALTFPPKLIGPLSEMKHSFDRPFENSPFRLVHVWIDIRPAA